MLTDPRGVIMKTVVYSGAMDNLGIPKHTTRIVLNVIQYLDSEHSLCLDNFNSFTLNTDTLNGKAKDNHYAVI